MDLGDGKGVQTLPGNLAFQLRGVRMEERGLYIILSMCMYVIQVGAAALKDSQGIIASNASDAKRGRASSGGCAPHV